MCKNLCAEYSEKYEKTNQDAKVNLVHKELSSFIENIVHDVSVQVVFKIG